MKWYMPDFTCSSAPSNKNESLIYSNNAGRSYRQKTPMQRWEECPEVSFAYLVYTDNFLLRNKLLPVDN